MEYLLPMAHGGQQGKNRLDHHALGPGAAQADFHVRQIALPTDEVDLGPHDHLLGEARYQGLEGTVVDVGRVGCPATDQAPLIEHDCELAPNDPAVVGQAITPDPTNTTLA